MGPMINRCCNSRCACKRGPCASGYANVVYQADVLTVTDRISVQ